MSQYSNSTNLLRGISDDNASFVTADDSNPDKAPREDVSFLNTHQSQRMEHVGYKTFDGYSYHDQNHTTPNQGYMSTNYQYGANAQNLPNRNGFGGLPPYHHSDNYRFQQQTNVWGNFGVQKDTRNMPFSEEKKGWKDDQLVNVFEEKSSPKEELKTTKNVAFDEKTTSEESSESEDSGSDFDPRTQAQRRRSYPSKRASTRRVQKRPVSPSDDESNTTEKSAPTKIPRVLPPKKSSFVPKTKPRNYKLKTVEERQMDPDYKLKRDRNNDAVRKSRKKSKEMEMQRREEMTRLQEENKKMRNEINILKSIPCIHCGQLPVKTEAVDEDF